jgi:hypothetical protein
LKGASLLRRCAASQMSKPLDVPSLHDLIGQSWESGNAPSKP